MIYDDMKPLFAHAWKRLPSNARTGATLYKSLTVEVAGSERFGGIKRGAVPPKLLPVLREFRQRTREQRARAAQRYAKERKAADAASMR
jgi:hypothetical protein